MIEENLALWFQGELQKETMIYLDNAATTYPKPEEVYKAMDYGNRYLAINAGRGSYRLAKIATKGMDAVREKINNQIKGMEAGEVIITPSATIAMNQIIGGLMLTQKDIVYVSPFEHNAVMRTLEQKRQKIGFELIELPLEKDTLELDLEKTKYLFTRKQPAVVFVTQVSNVTGYILPTEELYTLVEQITNGEGKVILDAAQGFGIVPIDYRKTPYDAIVFAGHKTLYGPMGIGGFVKKKSLKLTPHLAGGTGSDSLNLSMPEGVAGLEPGSPNIPAITGLYASAEWIEKIGVSNLLAHKRELTEECIKQLEEVSGVKVFAPKDSNRRIGVVSFALEGFDSVEVAEILDEDFHIAVRAGYHCAPLIHKYLKDESYGGTLRVSFGWFNTKEEVRQLVKSVKEILEG